MFSMSKLSRMETGHGVATPRDIRDLCDLYGVTDEAERERMMTARREGKQQAWWQSYDLDYATYVGLEAEAVAISAFQSSVVHGLLQTADYARAGHEGAMPRLTSRSDRDADRGEAHPAAHPHARQPAAFHRRSRRGGTAPGRRRPPGHGRAAGQDPGHVGPAERRGAGSPLRSWARIPRWRATSLSSSCQIQLPAWCS